MQDNSDIQRQVFTRIADFMEGFKALNTMLMHNIDSVGRFEGEFRKITRQNNQVLQSHIELRSEISALRSDFGHLQVEFGGLRSDMGQLRSEFGELRSDANDFRTETSKRLDAILRRLNDLENGQDKLANELRDIHIELRSQYNQILTASQDGLFSRLNLSELEERVS